MKVKVTFDINKARLIHLDWVMRIERILEQGPDLAPCALPYYQDCALGVWLHGEGRTRYRQYEDIRRLTIEHRRFHHAVEHMLLALHDGNALKAREILNDVRPMSKDIIYLLTLLELRTLEQRHISQSGGGFLAAIGNWFAPNDNWLEPPRTKDTSPSVDLTYARLAHLRWASALDQRFRNYGQGVALQAHDSCEFGAWIQKVGLKKYADIPEINMLEAVHREFHEAAARIIRHLQSRHLQRADESYTDVQILSREIAWLLTIVEYRLRPAHPHTEAFEAERTAPPAARAEPTAPNEQAITVPVSQLSPIQAVAEHLIRH